MPCPIALFCWQVLASLWRRAGAPLAPGMTNRARPMAADIVGNLRGDSGCAARRPTLQGIVKRDTNVDSLATKDRSGPRGDRTVWWAGPRRLPVGFEVRYALLAGEGSLVVRRDVMCSA